MADYTVTDFVCIEGDKTREIKDWLKDHDGFFSRGKWYLPAEHRNAVIELLENTELSDAEKDRIERQRRYREAVEEMGGFDREGLGLVEYTEKSFVVFGETKANEKKLKSMKGRYYPALKGYLFSNKHREKVDAWLEEMEE